MTDPETGRTDRLSTAGYLTDEMLASISHEAYKIEAKNLVSRLKVELTEKARDLGIESYEVEVTTWWNERAMAQMYKVTAVPLITEPPAEEKT